MPRTPVNKPNEAIIKPNVEALKPNVSIQRPNANLNITLSKDQLNQILKTVLGEKGDKLGPIAIASDHCCVDVSVGSSVAGPVSSVASSVSIPAGKNLVGDLKAADLKTELQQKLDVSNTKVNVEIPGQISVK